jgi:regulator of sigma E protease
MNHFLFDTLMNASSLLDATSLFSFDRFPQWQSVLGITVAPQPSAVETLLSSVWNIFRVLVGLGFVIFIHELGHFLAAKSFGVKCEKFYVGFDVPLRIGPVRIPSALFKFQWGETEYGIGAIPLGGYVKMLGQDDDPRNAQAEAERIREENDDPNADAAPQLDPRSFPAKNVFARMIIISAGVVMNLISAVIIAAIAYGVGVEYQPTYVASASPGDPAWVAGIQPDDKIVQVAGMLAPDEQLHFRDMSENIIIGGISGEENPFDIQLQRGSETVDVTIKGTKAHDRENFRMQIGVTTFASTTLSDAVPVVKPLADTPFFNAIDLHPSDKIVGVNGEMLDIDPRFDAILNRSYEQIAIENLDATIKLLIERSVDDSDATETVEVDLPAFPMRTLGMQFQLKGVSAVQEGSPAADADVLLGDSILELNGQPVTDALTLHLDVLRLHGQRAVLTMKRNQPPQSKKKATVENVPESAGRESPADENSADADSADESNASGEVSRSDATYEFAFDVPDRPETQTLPVFAPVGFELAGSGLVYDSLLRLSGIDADSPAEAASLQIGDEIQQIQFVVGDERMAELQKVGFFKETFEPFKMGGGNSAIWFHQFIQSMPTGIGVKVDFKRDGKTQSAMLEIDTSASYHWPDRQLAFQPATLVHQTSSVSDAFSLGFDETWKRVRGVYRFLKLAVAGKISTKAIGGPGMIFYAANSEASHSTTRLLLFLVLLSANLAVLNFLPIPALDGGHMLFLIYEAVTGKPVDENLQAKLTIVGMLALLSLMAFVIVNDVLNFATLWSR